MAVYDQNANPLSSSSLQTRAINLRASDGDVTSVELLLTPNAETNGLPESPTALASWSAS